MLHALKSSLGSKNPLTTSQLARHICGEECNIALRDIVISLLNSGYSVAELLSALLQAESMRMKSLFSGHSALPINVQFDEIRRTTHAFNDIQDSIIEAGELYFTEKQTRNKLGSAQSSNNPEDRNCDYAELGEGELSRIREDVIAKSMQHWIETRSIKLFNQFRGISINANAKLLGKGKGIISINLDQNIAKVFASHPDRNRAFLACPGDEEKIAVSIKKLDSGNVTLNLEEVSPLYVEKRRDLGVQLAEHIPVKLTMKGRNIGTAQLFDMSISGFGLTMKNMAETKHLNNGDELHFDFQLSAKKMTGSGWVRWIQNHDDNIRIGIELKTDKTLQQSLQREIFSVQRSIIVAMNEVELPDEIQSAL